MRGQDRIFWGFLVNVQLRRVQVRGHAVLCEGRYCSPVLPRGSDVLLSQAGECLGVCMKLEREMLNVHTHSKLM